MAAHDALLLDLDGVAYVGAEPVAHAAEALAAAVERGVRLAYVTNNASRRPLDVARHLTAIGIPARPDDVVTSAQAAARVLAAALPAGARVLVLGTDALADEVRAAGLVPVPTVPVEPGALPVPPPLDVAAVVQGYAPTTWNDLAQATIALRRGVLWVACNRDATLPSPLGPLPGNGAMVAALATATGREPVVAGKPEEALHAESVERVAAARPLVVGDRLDTDVEGAVRVGAASLLVLTGVVGWPHLLAAPAGRRPDFVGHDLRSLHEPHAEVALRDGSATCGSAEAVLRDGVVDVVGTGTSALRAGCALAWALADAGVEVRAGALPGA